MTQTEQQSWADDPVLIPIREGLEFDVPRFTDWLKSAVDGLDDTEIQVMQFGMGQSNPTFCIHADGQEWVLRKQPPGDLLPTAHDMAREYRILRALADTDVPAPRPVALCTDKDVIGTDFYLMQRMHGTVLLGKDASELPPEDVRRNMSFGIMDAAAKLHAVDYTAVGLDDYGKPHGYVERQMNRWWTQYEKSWTRDIPVVPQLRDWLMERIPPDSDSTIVHGDFSIGNVMYANDTSGRIEAILDWEISTLGDPLCDIGYCMVYWLQGQEESLQNMLMPNCTVEPGFATKEEMLAHYEALSGRTVTNLAYYEAFSLFRLACIAQGIMKRVEIGQAKHPQAQMIGQAAEFVAQAGWNIAEGSAL